MWPGVRASLPACKWRRRILEGGLQAVQADEDVVGTSRVRDLERRVRELERLLGRKTMEVEILKEALDVNDPPASSQLNRLPSYLGLRQSWLGQSAQHYVLLCKIMSKHPKRKQVNQFRLWSRQSSD